MKTNLTGLTKRNPPRVVARVLGLSAVAIVLSCGSIHAQSIITTVAGTGTSGYTGDGSAATAARLDQPADVETSYTVEGAYYVVDAASHVVRRIGPGGVIRTIAGNGTAGYSGDGGPATAAQLSNPKSVDIDHAGNIYISDYDNNVIRKVSSTGIITTFAGNGSFGYSGDGGQATAAELNGAWGLETDASGNVYISDVDNNVIRKVDKTTGVITTYAGNGTGTFAGDGGQATAASLNSPTSISLDDNGNLYILDHHNNRIRKVNASGVIRTIAGNGSTGFSGDGGPATAARLRIAWGIDADDMGNVYFSDEGNRRIRKIDTSGTIRTVVGTGSTGYTGDGGPATAARIGSLVEGLGLDSRGNLYVADQNNHVVRYVTNVTNYPPSFPNGPTINFSICAGSDGLPLNEDIRVRDNNIGQTLTWTVATHPSHGTATMVSATATSNGGTARCSGVPIYKPTAGYTGSDAMVVAVSDGITTATVTIAITVNPQPGVPVISGSTYVCSHSTTTLTGTPSGGTWSCADGNATINSAGLLTAIGGGATPIGYLSPANSFGCRTIVRASISIIDYPVPVTVSGAASVCPGASTTFGASVSGGTWTSGTPSIATISSGGSVTGVATGTGLFSYTTSNACYSRVTTRSITVLGPTTVPAISGGGANMCIGGTRMVSNSLSGGSWSSSNTSVATVSSAGVVSVSAAGAATIVYSYTNACGLTSYATKGVTVIGYPNAGGITGPGTVAIGDSINLTESASSGYWTNMTPGRASMVDHGSYVTCTGIALGTSSLVYTVTNICVTATANYSFSVTAGRGMNDEFATTGSEGNDVAIYPNPTSGVLTIDVPGSVSENTIIVTDMSGKLIVENRTTDAKSELDLSSLAKGMYLLNVSNKERVFVRKVLVQ